MSKKTVSAFCNECSKKTCHNVLSSVDVGGYDGEVNWSNTYQVLECGGCKHVTFRKRFWFSEWQSGDPDEGPIFEDSYFPPPLFREKPKWFAELDQKLSTVLEEVYIALQNNIRYLAAVGARTALDIILVDKVTDKGSFDVKLKALVSEGFVSEAEKGMLKAVTEAGNAAAHRGYLPEEKDLILVMDIIESVIEKLYISGKRQEDLSIRAAELDKRVPKRNS